MEVAELRPALGRSIAVVTFAAAPALAAYERELGLRLRFFGDPERAAYAAFGFGRASSARVWLHPAVWGRYAALIARGRPPRPPAAHDDVRQLGGDVLAGADGRVEWVHRSSGPEDRPSPAAILSAAAGAPAGA